MTKIVIEATDEQIDRLDYIGLFSAESAGVLYQTLTITTSAEEEISDAIEALKAKPCENAIDRQTLRAQFNHLDEVYEGMSEEERCEAYIYGQIIRAIDDAPPVTPEQKTGKWRRSIHGYGCPFCSLVTSRRGYEFYNYCPNCGAKLEREEKDE